MTETVINQPQMDTPKNKSSMMTIGVILVLFVLALVGVGVLRGRQAPSGATTNNTDNTEIAISQLQEASPSPEMSASPSATTEIASATPSSAATTAAATSDVKIVNVEAGSFYFKPNEIRVKKGEKVKIVMTSKDMMHDFTIDELGVKLPITKAGTTNSVEFVATKAGTFEFYCSVGQHRANGQVGKLIVE